MHKDNFFQKASNLLNTSSETFMLIALVSLFVLPVVMAKNLEPVIKDAYAAPLRTALVENTNLTQNNSEILGISTSNSLKTNLTEEIENLEFFDKYSSSLTDENYNLTIATSKRFAKIIVFKLKNTSASTLNYVLSSEVNGDLKIQSNTLKNIYVDDISYSLSNQEVFPLKLLVSPGQEVSVSMMSNKTSPTSISLTLSESYE